MRVKLQVLRNLFHMMFLSRFDLENVKGNSYDLKNASLHNRGKDSP